ncbi:MAG: hypothetical protein HYV63_21980 [Candidatus Schekmanbacteria bacterium]|nr:hypothetical protein [Candidatus Schekmanbacteria bacterium]
MALAGVAVVGVAALQSVASTAAPAGGAGAAARDAVVVRRAGDAARFGWDRDEEGWQGFPSAVTWSQGALRLSRPSAPRVAFALIGKAAWTALDARWRMPALLAAASAAGTFRNDLRATVGGLDVDPAGLAELAFRYRTDCSAADILSYGNENHSLMRSHAVVLGVGGAGLAGDSQWHEKIIDLDAVSLTGDFFAAGPIRELSFSVVAAGCSYLELDDLGFRRTATVGFSLSPGQAPEAGEGSGRDEHLSAVAVRGMWPVTGRAAGEPQRYYPLDDAVVDIAIGSGREPPGAIVPEVVVRANREVTRGFRLAREVTAGASAWCLAEIGGGEQRCATGLAGASMAVRAADTAWPPTDGVNPCAALYRDPAAALGPMVTAGGLARGQEQGARITVWAMGSELGIAVTRAAGEEDLRVERCAHWQMPTVDHEVAAAPRDAGVSFVVVGPVWQGATVQVATDWSRGPLAEYEARQVVPPGAALQRRLSVVALRRTPLPSD